MSILAKLSKQNEQTWINLQKRLNDVQFDYKKLFPTNVHNFIKNKAVSVGSCEGYFVPSLLTTSSFVLASNSCRVDALTHQQPLNLYSLFVGYPGTGKSSAIQHAALDPLEAIDDLTQSIISKSTSSGLVKFLSTNKQGIIISPEVYDALNKLLKSDEDNATGDIQLLCKLFSGEKTTHHFSTERVRTIEQNTPFAILGATQLVNVAKLIAKMDHGHGLIDRILIATPLALRPSLTQMEKAKQDLETTEVTQDFKELFTRIYDIDESTVFKFDANGQTALRQTMDDFVSEVNDAILQGLVPPKSKAPELIPRIAVTLHVFNHHMEEILDGEPASPPSTTVNHQTLENATQFVKHLESQKDILCQFLKEITNTACEKTISQPTGETIRNNVLLTQGPAITYRVFKHGKRSSRNIAEPEYIKAIETLQEDGFGRLVQFNVPRARGNCKVFVKTMPNEWPNTVATTIRHDFEQALRQPMHKYITQPMRNHLQENGHMGQ